MAFDKTRFGGVVAPIVNPCGEDDSLDRGALEANLTRLLATDVAGLYINGGTGDAANLTQDERLETAALLVPRLLAAGKLAIVHVGQTNQRQAVELARQAAALGAHAVASIPPKKPWPQIVEYYKALAAAGAPVLLFRMGQKGEGMVQVGDLGQQLFPKPPVIVYYIPGVTGMTAGMPELRMLLDIPGVVGIKMSDWNIFLLRSVVLEYPEKVVYSGFDEMLVPGLLYGADGCIGTWANLLPDLYAKVYARVRAGGADAVKPVMDEFTAFLAVGWNYGIIDTFEELMRARGYAGRCFRRPSAWEPGKVEPAVLADLLARLQRLEDMAAAL